MKNDKVMAVVDSLQLPNISGSVSVPLVELDRMRSDHANAVKVAQDLKSKWPMIIVRVSQTESYIKAEESYGSSGRMQVNYKTALEESKIDNYVNMEEILEPIRNDIRKEFQKSLNQKEEALRDFVGKVKHLNDEISDRDMEITALNEHVEALGKDIKMHEETIEKMKTAFEDSDKLVEENIKKAFEFSELFEEQKRLHAITLGYLHDTRWYIKVVKFLGY